MNALENYVKSFPNIKTQELYKKCLNLYFRTINADPNTYFNKKRDYIEDITTWWYKCLEKAPLTAYARLSTVKNFLEENDVEIPKKVLKQLKRKKKGNKPVTIDRIPTNKELRTILDHGNIKSKALFLFASSSGMRINEILNLEPDDIDFNSEPVKVYIRAEIAKFNQPRICYISSEAARHIKEWLKVRDKHLNWATKRFIGKKSKFCQMNSDTKTIFYFNYSTARYLWNTLLKDSGLDDRDKTTKFHRLHIHVLRKFFKTRMINAGVHEAKIYQLLGQEGYLSSYNKFTEEELAMAYKQGENELLVYGLKPDLTDVNKSLAEKDRQIQDLKQEMDHIRMELLEVKMKQVQELQKAKLEK